METSRTVAYFCMEIAVHPNVPTYAGGLGILAGDTLRSAADLKIPLVAVSLLYRKGYFAQQLDPGGWQAERAVEWDLGATLRELPQRAVVELEGRNVALRAWRYEIRGVGGFVVPVYLLDSHLPENSPWDRELTSCLYGGDAHTRLCQEVVLGIGGVRMLRALGYTQVRKFHMNEGHASLLTLQLLDERLLQRPPSHITESDLEAVRSQCVFTTHTPVAAGHDRFDLSHARHVIGEREIFSVLPIFQQEGRLNMTTLALQLSRYVNGVAKRHGEVSQQMFPEFEVGWITNGVHPATWTAPSFQTLFDRYTPGWRGYCAALRNVVTIPEEELWQAHLTAKRELLDDVQRETGRRLDETILTVGFGRRMTGYKRPDLLLSDLDRLQQIAETAGDLQIVYAGKAHPHDEAGKRIIQQIVDIGRRLTGRVRLVFLPNYGMRIARLMTAGVDLWLNTPLPPLEASGTSGMKAALNGVPSLSVLDGWWVEGCVEGVTGWAIHPGRGSDRQPDDGSTHAGLLYDKLERVILPTYYFAPVRYRDVMRQTIAFNGPYFNTHRMLEEYLLRAYLP